MVAIRQNSYQHIEARPFAPNLGAEIYEVDLAKPVSDAQFDDKQAFLDYQVLFFKDQAEIPPELHVAFGKRFGGLCPAAPTMAGHPETIHATKDSNRQW